LKVARSPCKPKEGNKVTCSARPGRTNQINY